MTNVDSILTRGRAFPSLSEDIGTHFCRAGSRGDVSFVNSGQYVRESQAAQVESSDAFLSQVDRILASTSSFPRPTSIFATTSAKVASALSMLDWFITSTRKARAKRNSKG